jgi:DNA-directed RNA polymerase specialized sigma24 family protein
MSGGLSGQTNEQLAKVLDVTPKAASQAAYRARRKLATALPERPGAAKAGASRP